MNPAQQIDAMRASQPLPEAGSDSKRPPDPSTSNSIGAIHRPNFHCEGARSASIDDEVFATTTADKATRSIPSDEVLGVCSGEQLGADSTLVSP